MPSGTVNEHGGMNMGGQLRGYFVEMHLHHLGVDRRQDQTNGDVACRAERPENIGVFVACVDRRAQADSLASPAACARAFLTYSAFVLAPEFDGFIRMLRLDSRDDLGEFFLNSSIASASCCG